MTLNNPHVRYDQAPVAAIKLLVLRAYRFFLHGLRPNSGLTRLSFNPLVNWLFKGVRGPLEARTWRGTPVLADPNDYHGRILWLCGSNDYKVSRTVNALLNPGDVLLDIGANHGSIGFDARPELGPGGEVHFFEPQPYLAKRLRESAAAIGADNVTVHELALYESDGVLDLAIPGWHSGMATLVSGDTLKRGWKKITVPVRATRPYLEKVISGRQYAVKIDVEGAEPPILRQMFQIPGLRFVLFEGAQNERWLFDFFHAKGFVIYGLHRNLLVTRLDLVRDFARWHDYHDFVAVPAEAQVDRQGLRPAELRERLPRGVQS